MKFRAVFVCLAFLVFTIAAQAEGVYQRTRDKKTIVWNNSPEPGDVAVWSGPRDKDGYATGYGTLTWYTWKKSNQTGSNIPQDKFVVIGHYSGNMVRGKLDGVVTGANPTGQTLQAAFVDGRRVSDWSNETPSVPRKSSRSKSAGAESTTETTTTDETASNTSKPLKTRRDELISTPEQVRPMTPSNPSQPPALAEKRLSPDSPAEGPADEGMTTSRKVAASESSKPVAGPSAAASPPKVAAAKPAQPQTAPAVKSVTHGPAAAPPPSAKSSPVDDSLRSLIAPPASLREKSVSAPASLPVATPEPVKIPSPPPGPQLTAAEATSLADIEARTWGYDLGEYQLPTSEYDAAKGTWSVVYEGKETDAKSNKHFAVTVDDKSKKADVNR